MPAHFRRLPLLVWMLASGLILSAASRGQEAPKEQPSEPSAAALPPVPKGVEVLARGPVHEAFATPTTDPVPTKPVAKAPPKPLEELPPGEKPERDVIWIGGYWAWDDERNDFLWVSGVWRTPPPGQRWVAGYWRADGQQWHWVPGFWTAGAKQETTAQPVTYLPQPPAPPAVANPGTPPTPASFYVPGHWAWQEAGYVTADGMRVWRGTGYVWTAGYWANVQPGYVWVPAHYRWTPGGYVFIPGYWDMAVAERGVLYAPVVVDRAVVGPTFVYTPAYAVRDTIVIDALFVRPSYCHYYFGDYYGPMYRELGFESCVIYSGRHYDAIFVYERYAHRTEPRWEALQLDVCLARHSGRAPCPPRTLVQQNIIVQQNITNVRNVTVINNTTNVNRTTINQSQVLVPTAQLAASKGVRTVALDKAEQVQAKQQAQAIQQVALQRHRIEVRSPADQRIHPRAATLSVPTPQPVAARPVPAAAPQAENTGKQGMLGHPNVAPAVVSPARPAVQLGAGQQPLTPLTTGNRPATGQPAGVTNLPRLQPPGAAAHPGAASRCRASQSLTASRRPSSGRFSQRCPHHLSSAPCNQASPLPRSGHSSVHSLASNSNRGPRLRKRSRIRPKNGRQRTNRNRHERTCAKARGAKPSPAHAFTSRKRERRTDLRARQF